MVEAAAGQAAAATVAAEGAEAPRMQALQARLAIELIEWLYQAKVHAQARSTHNDQRTDASSTAGE